MRQRSAKKAAKDRELDAVTPLLKSRSGGRCEVSQGESRCWFPADHRHHVRMRSQGGDHSLENLLHVCQEHHEYIHMFPAWSYAHGYLAHAVTS